MTRASSAPASLYTARVLARGRVWGAVVAPWHGHALARPRMLPWQRLEAEPILPEEEPGQIVSGSVTTVCPHAGGGVTCHAVALPPGMPPRRSGDGRSHQSAARAASPPRRRGERAWLCTFPWLGLAAQVIRTGPAER